MRSSKPWFVRALYGVLDAQEMARHYRDLDSTVRNFEVRELIKFLRPKVKMSFSCFRLNSHRESETDSQESRQQPLPICMKAKTHPGFVWRTRELGTLRARQATVTWMETQGLKVINY